MSQRFRILLYNVGYATALDGSLRSYLLHFYRYIYTPRYIIRRVRQMIYSILQEQQPDVCCFVEIHRKKSCVGFRYEKGESKNSPFDAGSDVIQHPYYVA
jgi:hypothetical protein